MRRRLPGIDAELSAAVERVAAIYVRCPEPRPDVTGERFHELEAEVDRACGAGSRGDAQRAIEQWEFEVSTVLSRYLPHAPLRSAA